MTQGGCRHGLRGTHAFEVLDVAGTIWGRFNRALNDPSTLSFRKRVDRFAQWSRQKATQLRKLAVTVLTVVQVVFLRKAACTFAQMDHLLNFADWPLATTEGFAFWTQIWASPLHPGFRPRNEVQFIGHEMDGSADLKKKWRWGQHPGENEPRRWGGLAMINGWICLVPCRYDPEVLRAIEVAEKQDEPQIQVCMWGLGCGLKRVAMWRKWQLTHGAKRWKQRFCVFWEHKWLFLGAWVNPEKIFKKTRSQKRTPGVSKKKQPKIRPGSHLWAETHVTFCEHCWKTPRKH